MDFLSWNLMKIRMAAGRILGKGFDPNQVRDESGKWSGTGGSSSGKKDAYGEWGQSTGTGAIYGYRGVNATGVGFGGTEGEGMYIAREPGTAAFFSPEGKTRKVKFKEPTNPLLVDNEPMYLLMESPKLTQPNGKDDSAWLRMNKEAYRAAMKKTKGKWDQDAVAHELTGIIKKAGYDAVAINAGSEAWTVLFTPEIEKSLQDMIWSDT